MRTAAIKTWTALAGIATALLTTSLANATESPSSRIGQVKSGFTMQANLALMAPFRDITEVVTPIVLIGGKIRRVNFGVGMELPLDLHPRYLIDLQFAFFRTADARVDMFVEGAMNYLPSPEKEKYYGTYVPIRYRAALGVRYWLHPNVATHFAYGTLLEREIISSPIREFGVQYESDRILIRNYGQLGFLFAF